MGSGIDVSAATDVLTALVATIGVIGALKIAPAATAVAYKWVKGAIFG